MERETRPGLLKHIQMVGLLALPVLMFSTCQSAVVQRVGDDLDDNAKRPSPAPIADDQKAKAMRPASDRALVYVYRDENLSETTFTSEFVVGKWKSELRDGTTNDFRLGRNTYYVFDVPAGQITVSGEDRTWKSGCTGPIYRYSPGEGVAFPAEPGSTYAVRLAWGGSFGLTEKRQETTRADLLTGNPESSLASSRLIRVVRCEKDDEYSKQTVCYHKQP